MTVERISAELWLDAHDSLGESPRFDASRSRVTWIDIDTGRRHSSALDGGPIDTAQFEAPLGAHELGIGLDAVAVGGDWFAVDRVTGARHRFASLDEPGMRFNDAAIDSRGRLWSATMRQDEDMRAPAHGTLQLIVDGAATTKLTGLTAGNGMVWSADDRHLYLVDSGPDHVLRVPFSIGDATLGAPEVWLHFAEGAPDGIAIDLDGNLWVALWGAGELHRYDSRGALTAVVTTKASQVTAVCFAGHDLRTLVITTAARDAAPGGGDGSLFRARVPVPGSRTTAWRGR